MIADSEHYSYFTHLQ